MLNLEAMRRNIVWWFAASLILSLSVGAGYGWYERAPNLEPRSSDLPRPAPVPWEQVPRQESIKKQYEYALMVGQHDNAEAAWMAVINHPDYEPDWVRRAQMQLGKHYLDEHELDMAQKHFHEMAQTQDERTRLAGEVGQAAVLSLQDQPQASLDALWRLVQEGGVGSDRMLMGMVLWTFERNYRNLGKDWDPEVRRWANNKLEQLRALQPGGRSGAERPAPGPSGRSTDSQGNRT
jgi:hypothetical protein